MEHFEVQYTSEYADCQRFLFDKSKLSREQRTQRCFYPNWLVGEEHITQLIAYQARCSSSDLLMRNCSLNIQAKPWKPAKEDDDVIYCPPAPVKARDTSRGPWTDGEKLKWKNRQRMLQARLDEAEREAKKARLSSLEEEFYNNQAQDVQLYDIMEDLRIELQYEEQEEPDLICYESISDDEEQQPTAWLEGPNGEKIVCTKANVMEAMDEQAKRMREVDEKKLKTTEAIAKHKARMLKIPSQYLKQADHDRRCERLRDMEEEEWLLSAEANELMAEYGLLLDALKKL